MDFDKQSHELDESELGTLEYWEKCYEGEIKEFDRYGNPGEIWFGNDIVKRLVNWIKNSNQVKKDSKIVDLGCGNGMLLVELAHENFIHLTGLDYSKNGISLCKRVAEKYKISVNFITCDILEGLGSDYDIILDKGTYDAISLSKDSKTSRMKYLNSVFCALRIDGTFIIVSCNWTEQELVEHFKPKFNLLSILPTPQFQFSGKTGNIVTICVFNKIK